MQITYQELTTKLQFSPATTEQLLSYLKLHEPYIARKANVAYHGEVPTFEICKYSPFLRLAVLCYSLPIIYGRYHSLDIPDAVIIDTLKDITLRATLYEETHHKPGVSKKDVIWFRHLINTVMFKLGSLQFQLFHMIYLDEEELGFPYMTFSKQQKLDLPSQAPVLNVHIQYKANLDPIAIEASFSQAKRFFQTYLPHHQPKAYLCYSWLLYPGNQTLLPEHSHILSFAKQFDVIASINRYDEAVTRIYGKHYRKLSQYPTNTTLQKNALHHFSSLGEACGVRAFETDEGMQ